MLKNWFPLLIVTIAGEAIFMLPFLIPRLMRSLMMEAWSVTNTQVGLAFSAYGITAMISYVVGGPFADKYEPRKLMSFSLIITAIGTSLLLISPGPQILFLSYAFFFKNCLPYKILDRLISKQYIFIFFNKFVLKIPNKFVISPVPQSSTLSPTFIYCFKIFIYSEHSVFQLSWLLL